MSENAGVISAHYQGGSIARKRLTVASGELKLGEERVALRVSRGGIFVGCTFVSWEALGKINAAAEGNG